jgi:hypothetical protein
VDDIDTTSSSEVWMPVVVSDTTVVVPSSSNRSMKISMISFIGFTNNSFYAGKEYFNY